MRSAVTSSAGRRAVLRDPRTKCSTGTRRAPWVLASSTPASSDNRAGMPSAAGEALQMLPARVALFWICTPPISRAASFSPSNRGGNLASIRSVQVVVAPIRQ